MTLCENVFLISIYANEIKRKPIKIYHKILKEKVNIAAKIIWDSLKKEMINFKYIEKNNIVGRVTFPKFNLSKEHQDVILTNERFVHIYSRHPEVIKHVENLNTILSMPDKVLKEKDENVIWVIKKIDNNVKVTLKMNSSCDDKKNKISIIQMQFMRDKEIKRMIKKERVKEVYSREK